MFMLLVQTSCMQYQDSKEIGDKGFFPFLGFHSCPEFPLADGTTNLTFLLVHFVDHKLKFFIGTNSSPSNSLFFFTVSCLITFPYHKYLATIMLPIFNHLILHHIILIIASFLDDSSLMVVIPYDQVLLLYYFHVP